MLAYREKHHSLIARDLSHIEEYTKEDLMKSDEIELIYRCIYRYVVNVFMLYVIKKGNMMA